MSNLTRARAIELLFYDPNDLDPVVWHVVTDSLEESCFLVRFTNSSDSIIYLSYDKGVTTHDVSIPDSVVEIQFQSNAPYSGRSNSIAKGTSIYVRGRPDDGIFCISGYRYVE